MDKLSLAFKNKANIGYIVAGYPNLAYTREFLGLLDESCLDILEIGIPYSDPLADGKIIAGASFLATQNGVTANSVFEILRETKTQKALVFLVYYNLILAYGEEKFLKRAKECGISGLIVPEMPFEESDEFFKKCENFGLSFIPLVSVTSGPRVSEILKNSSGFIYAVGALGVTGGRAASLDRLKSLVADIKSRTNLPVAVGFGVKNAADVARVKNYADGAIVGTSIVELQGTLSPQNLATAIAEIFKV